MLAIDHFDILSPKRVRGRRRARMEMIKLLLYYNIKAMANSVRSKVVVNVIFDHFILKKFPPEKHPKGGAGQKMKILAL